MKKLLLTLVALCTLCMAKADVTVYFLDPGDWTNCYIHYWGSASTTWPGKAVSTKITATNGQKYYQATVPDGLTGIIFDNGNNGGKQTVNLTIFSEGSVFSYPNNGQGVNGGGKIDEIGTITYANGQYIFTKAGEVVLVPGHIYFPVETYDKTPCYLYTWGPTMTNNWPGSQLTQTTINNNKFWVFEVDDKRILAQTFEGIQLNQNGDTGKTEYKNITLFDNAVINIYKGVVANSPEEYVSEGSTDVPTWLNGWVNLTGDFNNYSTDGSGVELTMDTGGIATWKDVAIYSAAGQEFEIKTWINNTDGYWGTSQQIVADGTPYTLTSGGGQHMTIKGNNESCKFNISFDANDNTLTVELASGELTGEDPETAYYVAGAFNGWAVDGTELTKQDNGTYTATIPSLDTFKITNGKWSSDGGVEYGSTGAAVELDTPYTLTTSNPGNLGFGFGGVVKDAQLTFDPAGPSITVSGTMEYSTVDLRLVGADFNNWSFKDGSYVFSANSDNTVYTLAGIETIEAGSQFKLSDPSWASQVGGKDANEPSILGPGSNSVKLNGNNMALSETLNNVTLTFNVSEMTLTITGTPLTNPSYYIVGNFTDNWASFVELNVDNNYTYKVDGEIIKFKVTNTNGWNGEEYGANANGDNLTVGTPYVLGKKAGDFTPGDLQFGEGKSVKNGTITLDPSTMAITVTGDLVESYAGWYFNFLYAGNDWNPDGVEGGENLSIVSYSDEVAFTPDNQEFLVKIWNPVANADQYYVLDSAVATDGTWVTLNLRNGDSGNAWVEAVGVYNVSWDFANHAVKFEPVTIIETPDITIDTKNDKYSQEGSVSDGTISIFTNNENEAVITIAAEGYEIYYKYTPNAEVASIALDGYTLAENGKITLPVGTGTLSVYASKDGVDYAPVTYTTSVVYDSTTSVDGIGVEADDAEFFTLQGVKVLNPENGIFIKVTNGKAEKVVL